MKNRSTSLLRLVTFVVAFFAGSNAFATLFINLSFDDNSLALNTTGTFTISGRVNNSGGGASNAWQAYGGPSTPGIVFLRVVTQDVTPTVTYNDLPVSVGMVGTSFLTFWGGASLAIQGPGSDQPFGAFLQIGNGTTDFISGTFKISESQNIGELSISDLNMSFSGVTITASAVPEPSMYAALAGVAVMGLACLRRRHRTA